MNTETEAAIKEMMKQAIEVGRLTAENKKLERALALAAKKAALYDEAYRGEVHSGEACDAKSKFTVEYFKELAEVDE